jgi:hypothetical protein
MLGKIVVVYASRFQLLLVLSQPLSFGGQFPYVALDSTCDVISFRRRCKLCSIFSIGFSFSWRFLGKAICFYCRLARHARDVHSLPLVGLASGRLLQSVLHDQLVSHVRNFMLRC